MLVGYILLGLSLSAPIGPINAAQLDKGIKGGFWHAWCVGLGALLADLAYMFLVYFGVVQILNNPYVKAFLWLFGFMVLLYTGFESIKDAGKITSRQMRGGSTPLYKSFLSGFFMSFFNPLSILFWLGIYGSILADAASTYPMSQLLIYSGGIVIGILIWDFSMAAASSMFRRFLTSGVLRSISILSGISLLGFGAYFGVQAARMLFL